MNVTLITSLYRVEYSEDNHRLIAATSFEAALKIATSFIHPRPIMSLSRIDDVLINNRQVEALFLDSSTPATFESGDDR